MREGQPLKLFSSSSQLLYILCLILLLLYSKQKSQIQLLIIELVLKQIRIAETLI